MSTPAARDMLSPHFEAAEFHRGHGWAVLNQSRARYVRLAVETLEPLREASGGPLRVISGERSRAKGNYGSSVSSSRHLPPSERKTPPRFADAAADLVSPKLAPRALAEMALRLMAQGAIPPGGVGVYPTFVHVDNRGSIATWEEDGGPPLRAASVRAAEE